MKKIFLGSALLLLIVVECAACDICGCGVGNNYIGILPEFSKRIVGLRYRHNSLLTHIGVGGSNTYLTTHETYRTLELWSGWNIGSKFRLMASVPYNFNEKTNQGIKQSKNGLGDISVSGFYTLLNKRTSANSTKLLVQSLLIGGGIKLPTGSYNAADKSNTNQSANLFQLGTGSVDFTASLMYDIRLQDAGLNIMGSYKINTANRENYRYGNKSSVSTQAYYKFRIAEMITLAPNAGVLFEASSKDLDKGLTVDASGGNVLLGSAGVEISFNRISIGANWQTPFSQNLAMGIVKANDRGMVHLSFLF